MDVITILGAMALAYFGMMAIYYRSYSNEKEKKTSDLMMKGIRNMRQGNLDRALTYFDEAYEYCIKTDDAEEGAEALFNMGIIYKDKGDNDKALHYLKAADDLYHQLRDNDGKKKIKEAIISIRSHEN